MKKPPAGAGGCESSLLINASPQSGAEFLIPLGINTIGTLFGGCIAFMQVAHSIVKLRGRCQHMCYFRACEPLFFYPNAHVVRAHHYR